MTLTLFAAACTAEVQAEEPPTAAEKKAKAEAARRAKAEAFWTERSADQRAETKRLCKKYRGRLEMPADKRYHAKCNDLPLPKVDTKPILESSTEECERVGGEWKRFSNTCRDSCTSIAQRNCGRAFSDGCDCGPDRCWLGVTKEKATCVANPVWYKKFPRP